MVNAHVQTSHSLTLTHNHACNAMNHALHAHSIVNAIRVLMASLSEIISALNVSQTNTSMVTLVRTVASDAYVVTVAQTSV